jgi:hypothetical protein
MVEASDEVTLAETIRVLESSAFDSTKLDEAKKLMSKAATAGQAHTVTDRDYINKVTREFLDALVARPETTVDEAGLILGALIVGIANCGASEEGVLTMMATTSTISSHICHQAMQNMAIRAINQGVAAQAGFDLPKTKPN